MSQFLSKRTILSGIIGLSALFLAGCQAVTTGGQGSTFSSVKIDTSAIRSMGYRDWANALSSAGTDEASRLFASRQNRNAPRLVIRITNVSLSMYTGRSGSPGRGWGDSGDSDSDYIDAQAVVVDRNGKVIKTLSQMSVLPSGRAGAWYASDNELKRVQALARNSVQWFERRL